MARSFGVGSIVAKVEADIRGFTRNMNTVRQTLNEIRENGVTSKAALGAIGTAAAAVGVAGAMGIKKMVSSAGEYNDSMKQMQLMTGETGDVMAKHGDSIRRMFREGLAGSYEEIAKPFARAQTYFKNTNEDIEEMTSNSLKLQKAFGIDPEKTLRTVSRMVSSFGIKGSDAYDMILKTMQDGGGDPDEIMDSFNEYAHDAITIGYSAEDFMNRLIYGMQKGGAYNVDKVSDLYREFMDRAKDVTPDMVASLRHLYGNDNLQGVIDNLRKGGEGAANQMDDLIVRIGNVEDKFMKRNLMEIFFGSIGTDLGNQFFEQYEEIMTMQTDFEGTMNKSWGLFSDGNLSLALLELRNSFKDLLTTVGAELLPVTIKFIKTLTVGINKFNEFLQAKEGRAAVAAWSTVFGTILAFITSAIAFGAMFWTMFGGVLKATFGTLKTMFARIPEMWKALKARLGFRLTSLGPWIMNMVGTVLRAIGAILPRLLGLLGVFITGITLVKKTYGWIEGKFGKGMANLYATMQFPLLAILELLDKISTYFISLLPQSVQKFANFFKSIGDFILKVITMPLQLLQNFVKGDTLNPYKILFGGGGTQNININTNSLDNTNAGSVGGRVARELRGQSLGYIG